MRNFNDPVYKDWRIKVLKRDRFKCQMPGCGKRKCKLQVHHIKKWSTASGLRYETSNGISLCYMCHKEVTNKERFYEGLLSDIAWRNEKGS